MSRAHKTPKPKPIARHLPILTIILLILMVVYAVQGPVRGWLSGRYRTVSNFDTALRLVLDEYVEPIEPDDVLDGALDGMVRSLCKQYHDRHSQFLPAAENTRLQNAEGGKYAGFGIEIGFPQGKLTVFRVFDDSPAKKAGLQPGDRILALDGRDLTRLKSLHEAVGILAGEPGTKVQLTVQRGAETLQLSLSRGIVRKPIVEHRRLGPAIGYIRIAEFPSNVAAKVRAAIAALRADPPVQALILDLRGNVGGFLDEAVAAADLFIPGGLLIVQTRCRRPREDRTQRAKPGGPAEDLPIIALINGDSASAAEVVAGALQDHGRARLLGTRTFGKGAVSKHFTLPNGTGLLLTTGRYFLPKGRQIEGKGIEPDIKVDPPTPEQLQNVQPGAERPDPQLDAAVKRLTQDLAPTPAP